jgi:seryl-tRNA synthetase
MIDITILRDHRDELQESLSRRGLDIDLEHLASLDADRRAARNAAEELRAQQKEIGKSIPSLEGDAKTAAIAEAGELAERYKERLAAADDLDDAFNALWIQLPNMTDPTAAAGLTEDDAVEVSRAGEPPTFDFEPKDHVDLGAALGVLDVERASKVSGSRFGFIMGDLAMMEFALVRYAMDTLVRHGFTPIIPPALVKPAAMEGTGFLGQAAENVYHLESEDMYLVGTAEVPLAAYHSEEILPADRLPLRYAGYSPCYRREAGSHGRDTRGIFRVHWFDKVEMFVFADPESATAEHERLVEHEKQFLDSLELPYRVIDVATADLGASATRKFDCEAWIPSQGRYRELTSTSNCTTFQARRLRVRLRDADGAVQPLATLNGTLVAIPRTIIALLENHQQADGSVRIPDALQPYLGGRTHLEPLG